MFEFRSASCADPLAIRGGKHLGSAADDQVERAALRQCFEHVPTVGPGIVFDESADHPEVRPEAAFATRPSCGGSSRAIGLSPAAARPRPAPRRRLSRTPSVGEGLRAFESPRPSPTCRDCSACGDGEESMVHASVSLTRARSEPLQHHLAPKAVAESAPIGRAATPRARPDRLPPLARVWARESEGIPMLAEVDQDSRPTRASRRRTAGRCRASWPGTQDPVQKQHVSVGIGRSGGHDAVGKHELALPQMAG